MMKQTPKIVMLVDRSDLSRIMYHGIAQYYLIDKVIMEDSPSKKVLIQKRIKRLGLFKVIGQLVFMVFSKLISPLSQKRVEAILKDYQVIDTPYPEEKLIEVSSVNTIETIELLQKIDPNVVVVNGTRIISEKVLHAVDAYFINTHTGITPKYRGVHGGYWALTQNDAQNCGVTVHLVDKGIDTGGILYQATMRVTKEDSFNTYPYLQVIEAIPLMVKAIEDASTGVIKTISRADLESKIWTHPTIWEYFAYRISMGVK